jgi:MFS family permease
VRPGLLRARQLALANGITAGAGLGEGVLVFMPSLAVAAFGVSVSTASFMTLPVVIAMGFGSPVAGRILDKVGPRAVLLGGSVLLAAGMLMMGLLASQLWAFYSASVLVGAGMACLLGAPVRYIMLNEAPEEDRAAAQGAVTVFTGVGQLLSGALVGAVAASAGGGQSGYAMAFIVTGGVALLLIPMALGLRPRAAATPPVATQSA